MRLHVMNPKEWDLPRSSKSLGCIEANGKVLIHPWASCDGNEIGFLFNLTILKPKLLLHWRRLVELGEEGKGSFDQFGKVQLVTVQRLRRPYTTLASVPKRDLLIEE